MFPDLFPFCSVARVAVNAAVFITYEPIFNKRHCRQDVEMSEHIRSFLPILQSCICQNSRAQMLITVFFLIKVVAYVRLLFVKIKC